MTRQRQWILQARESLPNDRLRSISRNQFERLDKTWFTGRYGFKDNFAAAEADRRRNKLKDKILAGVRNFDIEQYRKSDEEIQKILNTRVRAYYEAQNQKLNDWAEVDSLVWSLADDIIDSTNPDADHDGIVNSDTPLYSTDHNLEAFLPGDERTKRYSNARVARRALRVLHTQLCFNVAALTHQLIGQCVCQCSARCSEGHCCHIHAIAIAHCFFDGFSLGFVVHHDRLGNKPPGQSKNEDLGPDIPRGSAPAGTSWHPGILHPHDSIVPTNPTGVGQKTFDTTGPQCSCVAMGCNLVNGRKRNRQRHHRNLLLTCEKFAGGDFGPR